MSFQLSMVGLIVADMGPALEFYRRLGIDIPLGAEEKPFVQVQMESGVTIFWDTFFAKRHYPDMEPPKGGSRVMLEFFLADEAAVDAKFEELVGLGYPGPMAPEQTVGPYAAMIEDPDGNIVLLTAG
ncbi:MAG TPA: VOC family protein [Acidimicrobiia bacterium]|nr:VOC family protein [Acidimicrobiia bacterium]